MKKLLLILAIGAFVACNDNGTDEGTGTDTTIVPSTADTTVVTPAPDTTTRSTDTTGRPADTTATR